jgi:hypothetical protein
MIDQLCAIKAHYNLILNQNNYEEQCLLSQLNSWNMIEPDHIRNRIDACWILHSSHIFLKVTVTMKSNTFD